MEDKLLTPVGLRSLAPGHPDYKPKYYGDLRSRDAAYHLRDGCAGSINEIFDAEAAYHPRGCIAQAWSVAEGCAAGR